MAYDSSLCPYYVPSIQSDLHSFGVFNADISLDMESTFSADLSTETGYLQDAIVAWSNPYKIRRISSFSHDQMPEYSENCWNLMDHEDTFTKFSSLRQIDGLVPDTNPSENWVSNIGKGWTAPVEKKAGGQEHHKNQLFSSSSPHMDSTTKDPLQEKDPSTIKDNCCVKKKVAYPFDMVKPGGFEGDVTLEDINERMLLRPTRPVRHPVGTLLAGHVLQPVGSGFQGKQWWP